MCRDGVRTAFSGLTRSLEINFIWLSVFPKVIQNQNCNERCCALSVLILITDKQWVRTCLNCFSAPYFGVWQHAFSLACVSHVSHLLHLIFDALSQCAVYITLKLSSLLSMICILVMKVYLQGEQMNYQGFVVQHLGMFDLLCINAGVDVNFFWYSLLFQRVFASLHKNCFLPF